MVFPMAPHFLMNIFLVTHPRAVRCRTLWGTPPWAPWAPATAPVPEAPRARRARGCSYRWRICRRRREEPLGGLVHGEHLKMDDIWDITEGSLEVKLPTIWTDEKQSREEAERRERLEERRVEEKE